MRLLQRGLTLACGVLVTACAASHTRPGDAEPEPAPVVPMDAGRAPMDAARAPIDAKADDDAEPRPIDAGADARPPVDAAPIDPPVPPDPACEAPEQNADVTGATPTGRVELRYGFVGDTAWDGHDCYDLRLLFSPEPAVDGRPPDGLEVVVRAGSGVDVRTGTPLPVDVTLRGSGETVRADGRVTLDTYDAEAPFAAGSVEVEAEGWSVGGTFETRHCELIDDVCL